MLTKIRDVLNGKETADTIRAALDSIDDAPHEVALAEAKRRRAALLLNGDDAAVLGAEAAADSARIALDRNAAAREALTEKLLDAEAREAAEAFRQSLDRAVEMRDSAIKRVHADFPKAANTIAAVLEQGQAADAAIAALREEDLQKYDAVRPKEVGVIVWDNYYFRGASLNQIALPATKSSPGVGRFANAALHVQPTFGP